MKRSSTPNISAPLSRSVGRRKTFLNPICATVTILILILFAIGGILLSFAGSNSLAREVRENHRAEYNQQQQLRSRQKQQVTDGISEEKRDPTNTQGLLIRADKVGDIRISFRPDLAGYSSIKYIIDVVEAATSNADGSINNGVTCNRCNFYRAEPKLLLQGVIAQKPVSSNTVTLGDCPKSAGNVKENCPEHDPNCGCHGPIMTKGMVGWAGGGEGPDFFINTFDKPVDWWGHQHTVWGELDEESIKVVESTYELPAHKKGMRMLDENIKFTIELF